MKSIVLPVGAFLISATAQAADLGIADLPRVHAEYKANQARWAREFLDKTFAATMTLGSVSNVFGNDKFSVSFMETPSDWTPGVTCEDVPPSDFLISKNKGDSIFFRGFVKDHSIGSLDLHDCDFFDNEKAAADSDTKRVAEEAYAHDQAVRQAYAEESKRALDEARERAAQQEPPAAQEMGQVGSPARILSGALNDMFRKMVEQTGRRCKAITDHVWVTPEHISLMCDRHIRAAFIHDENGWRLGNPGE